MSITKDDSTYAQMGMAALIPGMQYMIDQMQAQLDELRTRLAAMQEGNAASLKPLNQKRRGRPPKDEKFERRSKAAAAVWAKMTPEQRSAEMKRRQAKGAAKQKGRSSHGVAAYWAKMTPAQRSAEWKRRTKKRLRTTAERSKTTPSVKMEAA